MVDTLLLQEICSLRTLRPSPTTNEAFSRLVAFCLTAQEKDITLQSDDITKLQKLSSRAESEMETYWATRIIASKNYKEELLNFWYYSNYNELTELEYTHASSIKKTIKNVLFIGGGPFPLTSILLCQKYGLTCTILERDKVASNLAMELIAKLRLSMQVVIETIDALEYQNYNNFDLIYVAALVGNTPLNKDTIITTIHKNMTKGSLLLCRYSSGAKKLLYPSISDETIKKIKPVIEVIPTHSIINSFFILQKT